MSTKPKYKVEPNTYGKRVAVASRNGFWICQAGSEKSARKIARALNAIEDKTKAKPFVFDWRGIPSLYKWAAMDESLCWHVFSTEPEKYGEVWLRTSIGFIAIHTQPPYPGDWRDSLQKRP
jgi:hypothetical protein